MTQPTRAYLAVLVAPLVAGGAMVATASDVHADWNLGLAYLPLVYLFALLAEIVIALPLFLMVMRLSLFRWWSAIIGGVLVGVLADILVRSLRIPDSAELARFAAIGAISGVSFWRVWCGPIRSAAVGS